MSNALVQGLLLLTAHVMAGLVGWWFAKRSMKDDQ